jgi:pimeloyl-ACP methyl ester carboxylesterase
VDALSDTFRVIRFDLPGFGLTGPNPDRDYRITRYVQTATAVLDHLGISRVDVAGNSLGGHVAWRLALSDPTRVRRLVLIDAAGYASIDGRPVNVLDAGRVPITKSILRRVTPKGLIAQGLRDVYFDDTLVTVPLIERHYRMLLRRGNRDAMIDRLNAPWEDREEDIRQVSQPVLIQWGAEDTWIPVTVAERFADDLPDARLIVYPDGGHVPMEEIPESTARDARAFLLAPAPVPAPGASEDR